MNGGETEGGWKVELMTLFAIVNEDNCWDIWPKRATAQSWGSSWSIVIESTTNAVTTAEKRPVYLYDQINILRNTIYTYKGQKICEFILPIFEHLRVKLLRVLE